MLQPPLSVNLEEFEKQFQKIAVLCNELKHTPISFELRNKVFHQELLKSSLFSARIEGNQLTLAKAKVLNLDNPREKQHKEISNVLKALKRLPERHFSPKVLTSVHTQVMYSLISQPGKFRSESSAIYDQFGNIVYLTPAPEEMKKMLQAWYVLVNEDDKNNWRSHLAKIAASHYYFEKIHPFIDGNGRTGRVIIHAQLKMIGIFQDYILPIDQYFDKYRSLYYDLLSKNTRNISSMVEFFLDAVIWATEKLFQDLKNASDESDSVPKILESLFPRREEIYLIIKDHPYSTLEYISRRFPTIPRRTIAYDMHQLVKLKLVIKHGKTRGVLYSTKSNLDDNLSLLD